MVQNFRLIANKTPHSTFFPLRSFFFEAQGMIDLNFLRETD